MLSITVWQNIVFCGNTEVHRACLECSTLTQVPPTVSCGGLDTCSATNWDTLAMAETGHSMEMLLMPGTLQSIGHLGNAFGPGHSYLRGRQSEM